MAISEDVVLKRAALCTRCVMIALLQDDLAKDIDISSTVARYNQLHARCIRISTTWRNNSSWRLNPHRRTIWDRFANATVLGDAIRIASLKFCKKLESSSSNSKSIFITIHLTDLDLHLSFVILKKELINANHIWPSFIRMAKLTSYFFRQKIHE
jgi:hypothetical protein